MARSDASVVVLAAVIFTVLSVIGAAQAAEAPAPSPASPAAVISPSFLSAFFAALVALVFGSSLRA